MSRTTFERVRVRGHELAETCTKEIPCSQVPWHATLGESSEPTRGSSNLCWLDTGGTALGSRVRPRSVEFATGTILPSLVRGHTPSASRASGRCIAGSSYPIDPACDARRARANRRPKNTGDDDVLPW